MRVPEKAWLDLYAIVLMICILPIVWRKRHSSVSAQRFNIFVCFMLPLLAFDSLFWILRVYPNAVLLKMDFIVIYTLALVQIILFSHYLEAFLSEHYGLPASSNKWVTYIIFGISEGLWVLSLFNGMFYQFDGKGGFVYTRYYLLSQIGAALIVLPQLVTLYRNWKRIDHHHILVWTLHVSAVVAARTLDILFDLPLVYPTMAVVTVLLYLSVNIETEEKMKEQQLELQDTQQKVMISQIQPHFLYNVLNTIVYLCNRNPKVAAETTVDFADYLRMNLNSMAKQTPVYFDEELKHTKTYVKLELRRFQDIMKVEYDIRERNFFLPVLTLQPIVENAVKHGVTQAEEGGTIWISTYADERNYYVSVKDNGVGFDTTKPRKEDGRTHIGMSNTIDRVKGMCGGDVIVKSEVGKGTQVLIVLPKKTNADFKKQSSR